MPRKRKHEKTISQLSENDKNKSAKTNSYHFVEHQLDFYAHYYNRYTYFYENHIPDSITIPIKTEDSTTENYKSNITAANLYSTITGRQNLSTDYSADEIRIIELLMIASSVARKIISYRGNVDGDIKLSKGDSYYKKKLSQVVTKDGGVNIEKTALVAMLLRVGTCDNYAAVAYYYLKKTLEKEMQALNANIFYCMNDKIKHTFLVIEHKENLSSSYFVCDPWIDFVGNIDDIDDFQAYSKLRNINSVITDFNCYIHVVNFLKKTGDHEKVRVYDQKIKSDIFNNPEKHENVFRDIITTLTKNEGQFLKDEITNLKKLLSEINDKNYKELNIELEKLSNGCCTKRNIEDFRKVVTKCINKLSTSNQSTFYKFFNRAYNHVGGQKVYVSGDEVIMPCIEKNSHA